MTSVLLAFQHDNIPVYIYYCTVTATLLYCYVERQVVQQASMMSSAVLSHLNLPPVTKAWD